ncbi:hypothetical protein [Runella sp.]|uniref:hypothetical protein n=1 Tax=Runella sp. TaxID=1960881 RepID=UPI003D1074A4
MKKIKALLIITSIAMCGLFTAGAQTYSGGTLPEVTIKCSRHTYDLTFSGGFFSVQIHLIAISCDNGFSEVLWV